MVGAIGVTARALIIDLECCQCHRSIGILVPGEKNLRFYGAIICSECSAAAGMKAGQVINISPGYTTNSTLKADGPAPG
jgi:hypothetical protein